MTLKNTTLLMILWLVCLQIGAAMAAVNALPLQNNIEQNKYVQVFSHDSEQAILTSDSMHHHNESSEQTPCCEVECQCCVGGCQSILAIESIQSMFTASFHTYSHYQTRSLQVSLQALFRPPINA